MSIASTVCVIYTPNAGRGRARQLIDQWCRQHQTPVELRPTRHAGDGIELARTAAIERFSVVVAAGGDGTVHEVANGLLQADRPGVAFSVWPLGSANDYLYSLESHPDWKAGKPFVADVGLVEGDGGRRKFFVNGIGIGFNVSVTIESRRIRCVRGTLLYATATLRAMAFRFSRPVYSVTMDGRSYQVPTLAMSVSLGKREGSFPMFPEAELGDGQFDYLHAGPATRWDLVRHLPNMIAGTLPKNHPRLWLGRCREVEVTSEVALAAHVDGEYFCLPDEGVRHLRITLLPARLSVIRLS
jgi:diacylglycerol kinase family enzyme